MSDSSFNELMNVIRGMVIQRKNATLYIKTDQQRLITLVFRDGNIDGLMYGSAKGTKALQQLAEIQAGSYRIAEDGLKLPPSDLPGTEQILAILDNRPQTSDKVSQPSPSNTLDSEPPLPYDKALSLVSDKLAEYLGPIAGVLVEDALPANAQSFGIGRWSELVQRFAREIPNGEEARVFANTTISALKNL